MARSVTVLVVVDVQNGLLEGETAVPNAAGVLERLAFLLAAARAAGTLIVHLQNDGAVGSSDEPGTMGWLIHDRVAPQPNEIVLRKTRDDGFDSTTLETVLTELGAKRLAVAGLLSEMCVSATVRGALARGFEVVLVHDAHATYDLEDIPASIVSRVAEHALGDEIQILDAISVTFQQPEKFT